MSNRTDLALESYESVDKTAIDGVKIREHDNVTVVQILNEKGAAALGKPIGDYITLNVESFVNNTDIFDGRIEAFADVLKTVIPKNINSVLVAGLGNENITADALGPKVNNYVLSTRHVVNDLQAKASLKDLFSVATITTGVLGETGIETCEIIKGVVEQIKPSCVIAVDALAASSADRLGNTVQFSTTGISPGSGVGNHRHEISQKTLGVPVVSIGIPTVVCTSAYSGNDSDSAFVTPREIDRITEQGAKLIGMGINLCLQKNIDLQEMLALVG